MKFKIIATLILVVVLGTLYFVFLRGESNSTFPPNAAPSQDLNSPQIFR